MVLFGLYCITRYLHIFRDTIPDIMHYIALGHIFLEFSFFSVYYLVTNWLDNELIGK